MPKKKTHSGLKKRIKVSGTGKLQRQHPGRRHYLEWKPSKRKRRLEGTVEVAPADVKKFRRMLGR